MLKKRLIIFIVIISAHLLFLQPLAAQEIVSRYATIQYEKEDLLREFNRELLLGSLSHLMRYKKSITWQDEIKNKVDVIVERVIVVLDMRPADVRFKLVLLPTEEDVQQVYRMKYNRKVDYIAFYAPKDKTVYLSVNDIRIGVFAHELGHLIIDLFYGTTTPSKIHEVLAQFVETHLMD
jgi:hypothetical protein